MPFVRMTKGKCDEHLDWTKTEHESQSSMDNNEARYTLSAHYIFDSVLIGRRGQEPSPIEQYHDAARRLRGWCHLEVLNAPFALSSQHNEVQKSKNSAGLAVFFLLFYLSQ